jgi:hypothetical protein
MNRLTNETVGLAPSGHNGSVSYGLDPVGNRLSEVPSLGGVSSGGWGFNADNEISGESYDQNGNVTAADGKTFSYNSQNQLVSMTASGTSAIITYDGDGNRVGRVAHPSFEISPDRQLWVPHPCAFFAEGWVCTNLSSRRQV